MPSFNRVVLVGNLTRDVELRYTPGGMAVTDVGLAVNEKRKTASGDWVDEATFVDVTLFGRTAEVASEHLAKGSAVLIEGRLKQDKWQDKTSGENRTKLKVLGERMQFLGKPTGNQGGKQGGNSGGGNSGGGREPGDEEYSDGF